MKEKVLKTLQADFVTFTEWNSYCDFCMENTDIELASALLNANVNRLTTAQENMYELKRMSLEDKYKDLISETKEKTM